jgi:urea transporter/murein DD-endopeptidase MepM/ murein hydrolase activator NlpD
VAAAGRAATGVLSAYGSILFVDHPVAGFGFLAVTFWFPNVGFAGLIAAAVGMVVGCSLRLPNAMSGVNVYSSLLVGLSLGAYYELNLKLCVLIGLSAALTVLLAAALRDLLWRLGRLPVLSVPFVVVALTAALAAGAYGGLNPYYDASTLPPAVFVAQVDSFFSALGSTFFSPHPIVGAVLFAGIFWRSRYLALLSIAGFLSGQLVLTVLTVEPVPGLLEWTGFNFALTAMALGGIFAVPSLSTFVIAVVGAGASALVTAALSQLLLIYSLPVMALPFLLTTLTLLAALRLRVSSEPPTVLLESPDLPEINFEHARLARTRLGTLGSVPLLPPFLGEWHVYQGFDGKHTHRDQWRYALDFHRIEGDRSYTGEGLELEEYYCFGLPVLSPAYGIVVATKDSIADNKPGDVNLRNNWGNHVVIQTDSGLFVLLAHLRQSSVRVREGERVTPGTPIAACGNSGRSPQPHLHMQVQFHSGLGGRTIPFHLVSAIVRAGAEVPEYRLVAHVGEGEAVQRAEEDHLLAGALQLPVGRTLRYSFTSGDGVSTERLMCVEVTLFGQLRLTTDKGASAAFEQRSGALGFYDRRGPHDPLLDLWLLSMGLTPLSTLAKSWEDAPPAALLPLRVQDRLWAALIHPLGVGAVSRYERGWSEAKACWIQAGLHELRLPGVVKQAKTRARIAPDAGCARLELEFDDETTTAELLAIGQVADRGVPAWEQSVGVSDSVHGCAQV